MIDADGKLFGKINIIDFSFLIIVLAMSLGLGWVALGNSPLSSKIKGTGKVEVMIAIRGARVTNPAEVFKVGDKAFLTIRNNRYDDVTLTKVDYWQRMITLMGPNNQPKAYPDPGLPDIYDLNLSFQDTAEITDQGLALGGYYLKVGNTVDLDGFGYRYNGVIADVKLLDKTSQ